MRLVGAVDPIDRDDCYACADNACARLPEPAKELPR